MATAASSAVSPNDKWLPRLPWHVNIHSRTYRICRYLMHGWWVWEISTAVVSCVATVCLVAVLAQASGRAQQFWTLGQAQLSLNTIVVAISTVIRASLLITIAGALNQGQWNHFAPSKKGAPTANKGQPLRDLDIFGEAASGSWGSLRLLWRTRCLHLTAIGAMITILSLAFDTFVQQALSYTLYQHPFNPSNVPFEALLPPRATSLYIDPYTSSDNYSTIWGTWTMDQGFSKAMISGMSNNAVAPLTAWCPSSNCTWPTIPTLAICSSCHDVKDQAEFVYNETTSIWQVSLQESASSGLPATITNNLSALNDIKNYIGFNITDLTRIIPSDQIDSPYHLLLTYYIGVPPIAPAIDKYVSDWTLNISSDDLSSTVTAYRCQLDFCIQAHNISVVNGSFTETLVDTWYGGQLINPTSLSSSPDLGARWQFEGIPRTLNVRNQSEYRVDRFVANQMALTATQVLKGGLRILSGYLQPIEEIPSALPSEDVWQALWQASNSTTTMNTIFDRVARNLTNYLRTSYSAPADDTLIPTVYRPEILVEVTWTWLVFPLSVFFIAQVFFVATILQTRRHHVLPWKAHHLPLLLGQIDDDIKKLTLGGMQMRNGLDDRVGHLRVRLEFDGQDGIAFRRCV